MGLESSIENFTRRDWQESDPDGTVRLAIGGIGAFARNRALPAVETIDDCESTVLVTGSADSSAEIAGEFDVETVRSYEEFLEGRATDAFDAVNIATPNATHGQYATAAAELGKHAICEKPLETTVQDAQEIVDACEEAGVTLMTAYRLRLEPSSRRTRKLIRDGVQRCRLDSRRDSRIPTSNTPERTRGGSIPTSPVAVCSSIWGCIR